METQISMPSKGLCRSEDEFLAESGEDVLEKETGLSLRDEKSRH